MTDRICEEYCKDYKSGIGISICRIDHIDCGMHDWLKSAEYSRKKKQADGVSSYRHYKVDKIIECCEKCPNCGGASWYTYYCTGTKNHHGLKRNELDIIPDWCPLPSYSSGDMK